MSILKSGQVRQKKRWENQKTLAFELTCVNSSIHSWPGLSYTQRIQTGVSWSYNGFYFFNFQTNFKIKIIGNNLYLNSMLHVLELHKWLLLVNLENVTIVKASFHGLRTARTSHAYIHNTKYLNLSRRLFLC